ncbi:ISL3 family transposase [Roseburia sp. 1XD42-34]|nr:ISL3 family transposase [Roseburia sp. 1XD42-34]RKI73409.1 ISL3 family transposase [Clostridium sp. 1xD42-85]
MHNHLIIELLGIKDTNVDVWDIREESKTELLVELFTKVKRQTCPFCKEKTRRVHSYRKQSIQGPLLSNTSVKIRLKKRRYLCSDCGHTFFERLQMVDRYQRYTASVMTTALTYSAIGSFTTAARLSGMTTNRVIRLFDKHKIKTRKLLPRAIAIDEFKGDAGGERFQTIIVDVENREIIDILPDRRVDTIKKYFQSHDTSNVEIVVMDLSKYFKQAVQKALNNPLIIADRFHYMRQVYWAFDAVRREVQNEVDKKTRIEMKRSKKLLWKSEYKLDEEDKEKVEKLLAIDRRLKEAYELKNKLDQWFKESDKNTVKAGFENCIQAMKASGIDAFQRVMGTFKRWQTEILQSFMYPFNNGYVEGINNTIKVLKRKSYGIKSFDRLKNKILWQQEVKKLL